MQIAMIIALPLIGLFFGWILRWIYAKFQLSSIEQEIKRVKQRGYTEIETRRKELLLETREDIDRERKEANRELQKRRNQMDSYERRLIQKEDSIAQTQIEIDKKFQSVTNHEKDLEREVEKNKLEREELQRKVSQIANMSTEDAKNVLKESLELEAQSEAMNKIKAIEHNANVQGEQIANEIVVSAMQRMASDITIEYTVASVQLPSEDMKGRIIGREGRNIRSLETVTGTDIIIEDTPEVVLVSCFDPMRREIARIALERLINDGRIHPARIEEVVQKVSNEIGKLSLERGAEILYDLNLYNMPKELVVHLGKLYFRSSYGQNVLAHSREVALLGTMIASELNADIEIVKRGGILHDIGKAITSNAESNHVELGVEFAKRINEDEKVINCVAAHHGGVPHNCIESVIVKIADAISASRPGARRDVLENYVNRLKSMEEIANQIEGVDRSYAIQAGRELRIIVDQDNIDDKAAEKIAREVANRIHEQLRYPGQVMVTVIRERRITEYAR